MSENNYPTERLTSQNLGDLALLSYAVLGKRPSLEYLAKKFDTSWAGDFSARQGVTVAFGQWPT